MALIFCHIARSLYIQLLKVFRNVRTHTTCKLLGCIACSQSHRLMITLLIVWEESVQNAVEGSHCYKIVHPDLNLNCYHSISCYFLVLSSIWTPTFTQISLM